MSLRTKLFFFALFIILLSVPLAYIFLTWSPINPLRFRLVGSGHANQGPLNDLVSYEVEVRNTSCVSLHMFDTTIVSLDPSGKPLGGLAYFESHSPSPLYYSGYSEIPAYGTIRCRVAVAPQDVRYIAAGDVCVEYNCVSQTRHQSMNFRRWVGGFLFRKPHLPYQEPSLEELNADTRIAELEPASAAPSNSPPP